MINCWLSLAGAATRIAKFCRKKQQQQKNCFSRKKYFCCAHATNLTGSGNSQPQQATYFLLLRVRPPPSKTNKMAELCFFDELLLFLEHCVSDQNSIIIAVDFNFYFEGLSNPNTQKVRDIADMFSFVQTVSEQTHGRGHTLDLVFHRDSDNLIYSTRICHDLTPGHIAILFRLSVSKPIHTVKFESIRCIRKINTDNFSVDIANGITPSMSLPDLNHHLRQMLDKHAPVCQRKVRHRRPSPWYSSVANQLRELKHERRIAERRWRSSLLIMHKQLYDAAKQKVIDLVRAARKAFCSIMVSSSATRKELFHNMITLLGKTNPLFLLFYHGVF